MIESISPQRSLSGRDFTRLAISLLIFTVAIPVYAGDPTTKINPATEDESGHGSGHHYHVAGFVGATTNLEGEHTDFTVGLDVERRLSLMHGKVGVGLFAEAIFAHETETILGVPIFYHATDEIKLVAGVARTFADDGHGGTHSSTLLRIGAGYDMHMGSFTITPTANADFIEGHLSVVYGIAVGIGF